MELRLADCCFAFFHVSDVFYTRITVKKNNTGGFIIIIQQRSFYYYYYVWLCIYFGFTGITSAAVAAAEGAYNIALFVIAVEKPTQ